VSDQEAGDWDFVIHAYTLPQAIEDGVLFELRPDQWLKLSGGKPIVVTAPLWEQFEELQLLTLWNEYVHWRKHVMETLPEEEQMFTHEADARTIWLIEDGAAFTILFKEDY
jgi:hypothetical protein